MRKLLAIALLAAFWLPFASSLLALAPASESSLPACCRRLGKHHCMSSAADIARLSGDKPGFSALPERCPVSPAHTLHVPNRDVVGLVPTQAIFAAVVSHPSIHPQTLAQGRINRERSNQRRGPPTA